MVEDQPRVSPRTSSTTGPGVVENGTEIAPSSRGSCRGAERAARRRAVGRLPSTRSVGLAALTRRVWRRPPL
jgi:hypothetical protein